MQPEEKSAGDIVLSAQKSLWVFDAVDLDDVQEVVRVHNVPEIVARIVLARGIAKDKIADFLSPTLKDHFPHPFRLKGMQELCDDLVQAIEDGQSFAIFGDFDVDGATSSAILYRFFKALGFDVPIYIPDRLEEGYGPNKPALDKFKADGVDIVLMADCGTTAFDIIQHGTEIGLQIVILDHHEAEEALPNAWHIINPKRRDDESGYDMLAACGVCFLLVVALNSALRKKGFYERAGIAEPSVKQWLDIVALGTVCDMVPLTEMNRLFVRYGFEAMNRKPNIGIQALVEVSRISGVLEPSHAGFALGPRINAGSRVHQSYLGAALLSTEDIGKAQEIAWILEDCNAKRKAIQEKMERAAIAQVEVGGMEDAAAILAADESWHPGLSGLVAGRLKEKYKKPAAVITFVKCGDGSLEGRGSGRSVPGVDIAKVFIDARSEGLLVKGGGHAMAGGFTIREGQVASFRSYFERHVRQQQQDTSAHLDTHVDGVLNVRGVNVGFVESLHRNLGPFGQGFSEPLFAMLNVRVQSYDILGESHLKVMLSDWEGGSWIKAMAFKSVGTEMGNILMQNDKKIPIDILATVTINEWNGNKTAELHIKDVRMQ